MAIEYAFGYDDSPLAQAAYTMTTPGIASLSPTTGATT
jgi:hypothetical protein